MAMVAAAANNNPGAANQGAPANDENQPPPAAIPFSLGILSDRPVDYSIPANVKNFHENTKPIAGGYNGNPAELRSFLHQLNVRGNALGWSQPLNVNVPGKAIPINITSGYNQVTLEEVQQYIQSHVAGHQTRGAQADYELFLALHHSLSPSMLNKTSLRPEQYKVTVNGTVYDSGACLLMAMIREVTTTSKATQIQITRELHKIGVPEFEALDWNVSAITEKYRTIFDQMRSFGQQPPDMVPTILDSFKACPDEGLKGYVQSILNDYYDDKIDLDNEKLLSRLEANYKIRVADGSYNVPTADQKKIIALEARLSDVLSKQAKHSSQSNGDREGSGRSQAWMTKAPSADNDKCKKVGDTWTLQRGNKKFVWCEHHKKWGRHKSSDCKANKRDSSDDDAPTPPPASGAGLSLQANMSDYLMDDVHT